MEVNPYLVSLLSEKIEGKKIESVNATGYKGDIALTVTDSDGKKISLKVTEIKPEDKK